MKNKHSLSKTKHNSPFAVLYLWYPQGENYRKDKPIKQLKKMLSRFRVKPHIIYINNSNGNSDYINKISKNEYEISGDNSSREFSGWQKGIECINRLRLKYNAVLFVNDMFLHNSFTHRHFINQAALDCALKYDAIVGKRMALPTQGHIINKPLIPYVRTHIFMASKTLIDALGPLPSFNESAWDKFFISHYNPSAKLFRRGAPISNSIKDFIFNYLTSVWYNKKPHNKKNFEFLKNKAKSILNAIMLSMRTHELFYYPLVDYKLAKPLIQQYIFHDIVKEYWVGNLSLKEFKTVYKSGHI